MSDANMTGDSGEPLDDPNLAGTGEHVVLSVVSAPPVAEADDDLDDLDDDIDEDIDDVDDDEEDDDYEDDEDEDDEED